MDKFEIDYQAAFEEMKRRFDNYMNLQNEYYALLDEINELSKYSTFVTKNILKLPMLDQMKILKLSVKMGRVAKQLCEKHDIGDETGEEVGESNGL